MKKEEFKQKVNEVLDELIGRISELESKADSIAGDAKEEYAAQLAKLKELRDKLSSKLNEYESLTDGKWDVVKSSASEFVGAVAVAWKESYAKISEAFRKDKGDNTEKEV